MQCNNMYMHASCRDNYVPFIFLTVCSSDTHVWETDECICAIDHYQTASANETSAPVCTACPPGSTTKDVTNSSECCKYSKWSFPFLDVLFCWMDSWY